MTLYLVGPSSIEYWRKHVPVKQHRTRATLPFGSNIDTNIPEFKIADLAAVDEAGLNWLSKPLHLLVSHSLSRRCCDEAVFHVCSRSLPRGSFYKISRNVMVSSPELSCLMSASSKHFPLFVELLYELCGHYRLPHGRAGSYIEMPPATNVASLASFASKVPGMRGVRELARALRYTCDNSLSPMETDITETMVFDPRMGGFGITAPQLNTRFEVARKDRRALPQSCYLPDLYWPQANISVEYDSNEHHAGGQEIAKDAIRRNGIEHLGTRVITLTWAQARNYYEFERVALIVASALGKRFGPQWDQWTAKRHDLHRLLVRR